MQLLSSLADLYELRIDLAYPVYLCHCSGIYLLGGQDLH